MKIRDGLEANGTGEGIGRGQMRQFVTLEIGALNASFDATNIME